MDDTIWIARDKTGELFCFNKKPYLDDDAWYVDDDGEISQMTSEFFKEVTFENSPKQLIIKQD